jgi:GNAT superfamily N-acetyltransferase
MIADPGTRRPRRASDRGYDWMLARCQTPRHVAAAEPTRLMEKVAVAPAYQGRGVGRALMTELIAAARRRG